MKNIFSIPFENTKLIGDVMASGDEKPNILFLHGAGSASRARWESLREILCDQGIGSYAFDFFGHGETEGELKSSSLEHRVSQALQVIKDLNVATPLTIIGSSMGAYIGVKVSQKIRVSNLIFLVPGMYDLASYKINFGPQFSEIIRKPKSWENSDAWQILERFSGRLLVIGAGKDEVVPRELTEKIYDSASHAAKREIYLVAESSHQIMRFLKDHPEEEKNIASRIIIFLK